MNPRKPKPTPPKFPRRFYGSNGDILTIPFYKLLPTSRSYKLKEICEKHGIPLYEVKDRRSKEAYIERLRQEFFARIKAKEALEAYHVRLAKWVEENGDTLA